MKKAPMNLSRRELITMAAAASVSAATLGINTSVQAATTNKADQFPKGFLWGAATAAHQIEGNNVNSDSWLLETIKPTFYKEVSGDACDSYHRYAEDIALLKALGLNTYRFSIEWARIEPVQGLFSIAELEQYRNVLKACKAQGLKTVVTFNHFTNPRWFAALGGWENPKAPDLFAAYCTKVAKHIGDLIDVALTLNEPNIPRVMRWTNLPSEMQAFMQIIRKSAAKAVGSNDFSTIFSGDPDKMLEPMLAAHLRGIEAIKFVRADLPVGVSLAIIDDQAVGENSKRDAKREDVYAKWLGAAAQGDLIGVQTYSRSRLDDKGVVAPPAGAELNQVGDEFYPESLEATIRYAHAATKKPVYVTENGIPTEDDSRRVEYIRRAVKGVKNCLDDGIPVRSYIHWSLLDNFEWALGYRPKYGLVACDPQTFKRTPKPSASYLGAIARRNSL